MTSDIGHTYQVLKESYFHRQWGDVSIGRWDLAFVAGSGSRHVAWMFSCNAAVDEVPRGYFNSVRQRFELGKSLPQSGSLLTRTHGEGDRVEVLVDAIEGEPLAAYLKRAKPSLRISLGLFRDVVAGLRELAGSPRILSNVSASDFLVKSLHGAAIEAVIHPVFPIIRDEVSRTDFEVACFWGEYIARLFAAAKDGWSKDVSDYDPVSHRVFKKLLKTLYDGRDLSTAEALEELERCLRREVDALRPAREGYERLPLHPLGAIRQLLMEALALEYPEKFANEPKDAEGSLRSPFVLPLESEDGSGSRQGVLLPPEGWFEESLIQSVNRQMATPFLADHPNTARIRSLLCEESFSLIVTDPHSAIPLPALLQLKGGVDTADAMRLAEKIRRALDQFDSAEFQYEIESPWQVEVYLLKEGEVIDLCSLSSKPCSEWPVWDVRLRVEIPAEAVIEPADRTAWSFLLQKLEGKSFPTLLAWMLEWRRLEWAARQGALEREPVSWDRRFDSLFTAAADFFEPGNPSHRARLLSLLREGHGSESGS